MLTNRHENTTEWPKSYAPFAVIAIQKYVQAIKRPTRPTLHICIMMCSHLWRVIPKLNISALYSIFGFNGRGREIFRPQNHNSPARSGCPHARSATDEGQDWASFAMRRRFFCASELWFLRLHFRRSWWKSSLVFSCFILPSLFFLRLWDLEGKNKKYYREIFPPWIPRKH